MTMYIAFEVQHIKDLKKPDMNIKVSSVRIYTNYNKKSIHNW